MSKYDGGRGERKNRAAGMSHGRSPNSLQRCTNSSIAARRSESSASAFTSARSQSPSKSTSWLFSRGQLFGTTTQNRRLHLFRPNPQSAWELRSDLGGIHADRKRGADRLDTT